ncbi:MULTISPECIES: ABC transporter permease [Paenibacillus]|jgi:teichoic acid transport system permease protein|uniref:Transport permease protein n=1 Tax=Paenibacillus odorifer TaxID=189426 RepID=A0ABX3GG08_9BACL|nr:ABC transporter permease [Paenibacillus odorifer]OMD06711.1 ABC transporter permease [Paenibacillus odorifer]
MKLLKHLILLGFTLVIFIGSYYCIDFYIKDNVNLYLHMDVKSEISDDYQIFFATSNNGWNETDSIGKPYPQPGIWQSLEFKVPKGFAFIRIDPGNKESLVSIKNVHFSGISDAQVNFNTLDYKLNQLELKNIDENSGQIDLQSTGNDPSILFNMSSHIEQSQQGNDSGPSIISLIISFIVAGFCYFIGRFSKETFNFAHDFLGNKNLIINLAKNDFKTKYASSYLGVLWGFINPLLTIVTYWFVFQVGLRSGDVGNIPFIIWFIAGIIPWFFFSDAFSSATNAFTEYNYLVKKVVFKIELLPLVKVFSAFFVHLFFIAFILIVYAIYGYYPTLYNAQLIYYVFCLLILVISLSFFTSAVVLFFKDLNQIIAVILQMGFWFTPIGWSVTMLSDFWGRVFKLNPMFYIVQGFRDSLIDNVLFFDRPYQTAYFWFLCFLMLTFGLKVFKKLKPHFSDVL